MVGVTTTLSKGCNIRKVENSALEVLWTPAVSAADGLCWGMVSQHFMDRGRWVASKSAHLGRKGLCAFSVLANAACLSHLGLSQRLFLKTVKDPGLAVASQGLCQTGYGTDCPPGLLPFSLSLRILHCYPHGQLRFVYREAFVLLVYWLCSQSDRLD